MRTPAEPGHRGPVPAAARHPSPPARNLLQAGLQVTVWSRTSERTRPLYDLGASVARTPADAAEAAVVITMVSTPDAVRSLALEPPLGGRPVDLCGRSGREVG